MSDTLWDEISGGHAGALRDRLLAMVRHADGNADRSQQRHLGPSEVGDPCTYCLASKILGTYSRDDFYDPWPAIIGTSVHHWLELAAGRDNRDNDTAWCAETKVFPDNDLLPKGGKADLYEDTTRTVIDHKVVGQAMLKKYKANGPGVTYRRQGHIYGLGFVVAGLPVEHVAIAFWHRGGRMTDLHVWSEPYDEAYAREALDRYRTLRDLCNTLGEAILPSLPSDPSCFTCTRNNRVATPAA
jgi:hypothetical protein